MQEDHLYGIAYLRIFSVPATVGILAYKTRVEVDQAFEILQTTFVLALSDGIVSTVLSMVLFMARPLNSDNVLAACGMA